MTDFYWTLCLIVASYLLGSLPFSLLLGLWRGVDIRRTGSGNVGATNLGRALGRSWAIVAFLLDFSKGLLPVAAANALAASGRLAASSGGWGTALVGLAAVLGHIFPPWLRFRGGKGVATTFGVMTGLSWPSVAVAASVWALLFAATRVVSVASLGAAGCLPIAVWLLEKGGGYPAIQVFSVAIAALIFVRHRRNILRLLRGDELSFRRTRRRKSGDGGDHGGT